MDEKLPDIPSNLNLIIRELDQKLKDEGVRPIARPIRALMEFGTLYQIPIPFCRSCEIPQGVPSELKNNAIYTDQILEWYETTYGDLIKIDPSEDAKVAVLADGDLWELKLPIIFGECDVYVSQELTEVETKETFSNSINVADALTDITQARLKQFMVQDLKELFHIFILGLKVRNTFSGLSKQRLFDEAESDWSAAARYLTKQRPNFGQSRWSSLQFSEKFLKGIIIETKATNTVPRTHDLTKLQELLSLKIGDASWKHLIAYIECNASVRYGEEESSRDQAYLAHKASMQLVRIIGELYLDH